MGCYRQSWWHVRRQKREPGELESWRVGEQLHQRGWMEPHGPGLERSMGFNVCGSIYLMVTWCQGLLFIVQWTTTYHPKDLHKVTRLGSLVHESNFWFCLMEACNAWLIQLAFMNKIKFVNLRLCQLNLRMNVNIFSYRGEDKIAYVCQISGNSNADGWRFYNSGNADKLLPWLSHLKCMRRFIEGDTSAGRMICAVKYGRLTILFRKKASLKTAWVSRFTLMSSRFDQYNALVE